MLRSKVNRDEVKKKKFHVKNGRIKIVFNFKIKHFRILHFFIYNCEANIFNFNIS